MTDKLDILIESLKDHRPANKRWSEDELERLKALLNHFALMWVSDAIGSLQLDLIDCTRQSIADLANPPEKKS